MHLACPNPLPRKSRRSAADGVCHRVSLVASIVVVLVACRRRVDEAQASAPNVDEALEGLPRDAPIPIRIETTHGSVACELDALGAPHAVAMFVGLATGRATWRDPKTGTLVRRPLYVDLPVFRAIDGVLFQTGCPVGNGTGHPGYRIPVEARDDDDSRLQRPGALLLARYQAPPNRADPSPPPPGNVIGSQFVVALTDMHHLAGQVTVIGACRDLATARDIASRVARNEPVRLVRVSVSLPSDGGR